MCIANETRQTKTTKFAGEDEPMTPFRVVEQAATQLVVRDPRRQSSSFGNEEEQYEVVDPGAYSANCVNCRKRNI